MLLAYHGEYKLPQDNHLKIVLNTTMDQNTTHPTINGVFDRTVKYQAAQFRNWSKNYFNSTIMHASMLACLYIY